MNFGRAAPTIAAGRLRTFIAPRKPDAPPPLRLGRTYTVQAAPGAPPLAEVLVTSLRSLYSDDLTDGSASQFGTRDLALDYLGPQVPIYLITLKLDDEATP